jgi:hypothetical protein
MQKFEFLKKTENEYSVMFLDNGRWIVYGSLILNKDGDWVLWTGHNYSSEESGLSEEEDFDVTYSNSLEETYKMLQSQLIQEQFDQF